MMGRIASENADYVILTSDNSRSEDPQAIINEILLGMTRQTPYTVILDRKEAIESAVQDARAGDILYWPARDTRNTKSSGTGNSRFANRRSCGRPFRLADGMRNEDTGNRRR